MVKLVLLHQLTPCFDLATCSWSFIFAKGSLAPFYQSPTQLGHGTAIGDPVHCHLGSDFNTPMVSQCFSHSCLHFFWLLVSSLPGIMLLLGPCLQVFILLFYLLPPSCIPQSCLLCFLSSSPICPPHTHHPFSDLQAFACL